MRRKIITRRTAIREGLHQYYTGRPCKHGHLSPRTTKSCDCTECIKTRYARTKKSLILEHGKDGAQDILRKAWRKGSAKHREIVGKEAYAEYMREYMRQYRLTPTGEAITAKAIERYYAKKKNNADD